MPMNFYISDLHLFHKNVTRAGKDFDDRPFDNLEVIVMESERLCNEQKL